MLVTVRRDHPLAGRLHRFGALPVRVVRAAGDVEERALVFGLVTHPGRVQPRGAARSEVTKGGVWTSAPPGQFGGGHGTATAGRTGTAR